MMIYTIKSKSNDFCMYVGSTSMPLNKRWNAHKSKFKNGNSHIYQFIRNNGGIDNFYIELYEEFVPLSTNKDVIKAELKRREGQIIKELKCNPEMYILNKNIAGRDGREYYNDNRESILERQRNYDNENREHIKEYKKSYYIKKKESKREILI